MSADTNYDYDKYLEKPSVQDGSNSLAHLTALAQKQLDAEARVAACQAELTKATEALKNVAERELPEAMEEIGMETFKTRSGLTVNLDTKIRASIAKTTKDQAFAWLRARGHAALIKRKVTVEFGKGEDDKAAALAKDLEGRFGLVVDESAVHPSTLSSFAKTEVEKGTDIPFDLFGIHKQRVSKIVLPK